jgi:hypothetical protein
MTVDELRKKLEGIPGHWPIAHTDESWFNEADWAGPGYLRPSQDDEIGEKSCTYDHPEAKIYFLIGSEPDEKLVLRPKDFGVVSD